MGQEGHAPAPAEGSALRERLSIRRGLSEPRYWCRDYHAVCRHRSHAEARQRDRPRGRARRACSGHFRSGRLAHDTQAKNPEKSHNDAAATVRNSTQRKTSGNTCARIIYRTSCSQATRPSSMLVRTRGAGSSTSPAASHPSRRAIGPRSVSHYEGWYKEELMARKDLAKDSARKDKGPNVSRRKFIAGVAVTGAATAVSPQDEARAATAPVAGTGPSPRPSALRPNAHMAVAETGTPKELAKTAGPDGSDFMVDVIKTLNIDYVCSNPASSFRALHESLIDYGGNKKPEFITCTHEESSVGMGHGYFKATGKPLMMLCHGTVGLQHATMAIYNAWCDRVPVVIIGGNDLDAAYRAPGVPTYHSAQDINALVRDFTKWDDQPVSLQHFAQSMVRAYKIAMAPPHEPVMIALDLGLQQEASRAHERETLYIPKYVP